MMKGMSVTLSRESLLKIHKSFVKPLLDYADIIYGKPVSDSFKKKLEAVQYNAGLVITGVKKVTSREWL